MHHGTNYGTGPQERIHQQAARTGSVPEKCPYEAYTTQIPDCCAAAAAAAAQDPYPRTASGYDGRCYDDCHRRVPYQEDSYSQVRDSNLNTTDRFLTAWNLIMFQIQAMS